MGKFADVAQVVAHILGKDEVTSSSLVISSSKSGFLWKSLFCILSFLLPSAFPPSLFPCRRFLHPAMPMFFLSLSVRFSRFLFVCPMARPPFRLALYRPAAGVFPFPLPKHRPHKKRAPKGSFWFFLWLNVRHSRHNRRSRHRSFRRSRRCLP